MGYMPPPWEIFSNDGTVRKIGYDKMIERQQKRDHLVMPIAASIVAGLLYLIIEIVLKQYG